MFIYLTLISGNTMRFNVSNIANYVKYDYIYKDKSRQDDFTTIYTADCKQWTVKETPEEIDTMIINNNGFKY